MIVTSETRKNPGPMKSYSLLEHPADVGIRAEGSSIDEAFEAAAEGAVSLMIDGSGLTPEKVIRLSIDADDEQGLLFNLISELIYRRDAEHFLPFSLSVEIRGPDHLDAVLSGCNFTAENPFLRSDVKAMTYHQMSINREHDRWVIQFFVDV